MGDFGEFLEELEMVDDVMREHRSGKVYLLRADPFTTYSNRQFKRRYRFSKTGVERVFERIGEGVLGNMAGNSGLPVSPILQLMICMNLFASGSYQESVGEVHGVSQATISRIVGKVSRALAGLRPEIIQFPSSMQELRDEKKAFYGIARMPKIIGCIDCTHVKICNPGGADAQGNINRKNFFSINVQVVAGADLKIKNIVARWRGITHDSRIFNESKLKEKFEQGLYRGILLGDSGYVCQSYLLTPVWNPQIDDSTRTSNGTLAPSMPTNKSVTTEIGMGVWVGSWSEEEASGVSAEWLSSIPSHPHWLQYPPLNPEYHYLLGTLLVLIGTAGVLGNGIVLFVFTRFRRLRGPASSFIVNLAVADLCNSLLHSMAAASSFRGGWAFGNIGCVMYACGVGYFGLLSIVTLAAIAVERYMVITAKPLSGNWKMTQYGARKVCVVIWFYCALMSAPPLFGWSRYIAEGFMTSCSWDYLSRTPANRAYYIYLLTLGFVAPVCVIAYCYAFILAAIRAHGKEMAAVNEMMTGGSPPSIGSSLSAGGINNCRSHYHYHANHCSPHHHHAHHRQGPRYGNSGSGGGITSAGGHPMPSRSSSHRSCARSSNAVRTAEVILTLVLLFLISWTPYSVISFIGQFGDMQMITPWTATLPAIFAKASVIYNPIVYGLSHPHFRSSVRQYLSACTTAASAGQGTTASLMRKHSPQVPLKRKAETKVLEIGVDSPEPSVASAPAGAEVTGAYKDGDTESRRMIVALLRTKHRRRPKHHTGNPTSSTSNRHHVHFRYPSGEFLSEPDHHHHVTLLLELPPASGTDLEMHLNSKILPKEDGVSLRGSDFGRRIVSAGDEEISETKEESKNASRAWGRGLGEDLPSDDGHYSWKRPGGHSEATLAVYDGNNVCCVPEKGIMPKSANIWAGTKSSYSSSASKSRWEKSSLL